MYLSELTALPGVSGDEGAVRSFVKEKIAPFCDRLEVDSMGNLMAFKMGKQGGKTLLLCAHMDEVGLIVSRITEAGFLKFKPVGGIDPRVLVSKRVLVGKEGHPGVIGRRAIHLLSAQERKKAPKMKELYIDVGANNKKEAEKNFSEGDYVVIAIEIVHFGEHLVKAKALDDRVGCAILLELIKEEFDCNLCFAFTVQEEVGLRGARLCARRVKPDLCLILEGTTCSDIPDTAENMISTRLGGGAAVSFVDGSTSYDRDLVAQIVRLAKEKGIPLQLKQTATGGNDAGAVHVAAGGIKTASISVPARYIHSPASVISLSDYDAVRDITRILIQEAENV